MEIEDIKKAFEKMNKKYDLQKEENELKHALNVVYDFYKMGHESRYNFQEQMRAFDSLCVAIEELIDIKKMLMGVDK